MFRQCQSEGLQSEEMPAIIIFSWEVLSDIKAAAWLEQELHPELDRHRRHQMADICEPLGGLDRVWRVLGAALAEARLRLIHILSPETGLPLSDELEEWETALFRLRRPLESDRLRFLKEKLHEFLVARVMADRTAEIIPQGAAIWRDRADLALGELASVSNAAGRPFLRPLSLF